MEFLVHTPQNINPEGTLWQTWYFFSQRFKYYQSTELQGTPLADVSSILLFAANHQIDALCSSLSVLDLDLPKLNVILQMVEEVCLPYFILLFERFRYFHLNREILSQTEDPSEVLEKQAAICEFDNLKDSIVTYALSGSLKSGMLLQHLANPEVLHMDDIRALFSEIEKKQSPPETKKGKQVCTSDTAKTSSVSGEKTEPLKIKNPSLEGDATKQADIKEHTSTVTGGSDDTSVQTKLSEAESKKKFHCCFCDRIFVGSICLGKHLARMHKRQSRYSCKECDEVFTDAETYLSHCREVHAFVPVKKVRVQPKPPSPPQAVEDIIQPLPLPITLDEYKSPAKKGRRRKIFIHPCTVCDKVFESKDELYAHIRVDHSKTFLCWYCDESFHALTDYKIHLADHATQTKFSCELCQRKFSNFIALYIHLHKHRVPSRRCDICGAIFVKSESLMKHLKQHIIKPLHNCDVCGKSFMAENKLQTHMWSHTKRFTCELCGKAYAHVKNFVDHKRWHAGEKPYGCDYCGKHFRCSGDLARHRRKHYDKYAYKCEVCGRGFSFRSGLSRHRLGHTGKRSYICNVCGRSFIYREGLRDHMKASRCPGKMEFPGQLPGRMRKTTKLMQNRIVKAENLPEEEEDAQLKGQIKAEKAEIMIPDNLIDGDSEIYIEVQTEDGSELDLSQFQSWHIMLSEEGDEAARIVLVQ